MEEDQVEKDRLADEAVRKYRSELSRKGGQAIVKKYGKDHMRELGKKSAAKRWPK